MKKTVIGGTPFLQFTTIPCTSLLQVFTVKSAFFHPGREAERERLKSVLGIDNLSVASQVHGTEWVVVESPLRESPPADALLTDRPGVYLGVLVADCLPLLFVDARRRALAVVHAGWRGIVGGIHRAVLQAMREVFGSTVGDLYVGIGPGIGRCCFEVQEEVAQRFTSRVPGRVHKRAGRFFVDLCGVVEDELLASGIAAENLENSGLCTRCGDADLFHSFRREKECAGRNMLLAGWEKRG